MKAKIFLCLWMIFFIACSDDSVSFNANDAEAVSVKAYFSRLGDSTNTRVKADTILPTDSILLIALIEPSRSIRMENFYWQIDNGKKFSEFSHRTLNPRSRNRRKSKLSIDFSAMPCYTVILNRICTQSVGPAAKAFAEA